MAARIDGEAMLVREGERATAFTLDILAGMALLDPDGRAQPVRLMRWGEKCALARFASVGAGFVEARLIDLCAPGHDPAQRDSLIALILWLHAPDGRALPLDGRVLAQVTRSLCPLLGIGPDALMAMAAPDVEALWQGEDRPQRAAFQSDALPDNVTRILIEPDREEAAQGDLPLAKEQAATRNAAIPETRQPELRADREQASVTGDPLASRPALAEPQASMADKSPAAAPHPAQKAARQPASPVETSAAPSRTGARQEPIVAAPRFRLLDSAPPNRPAKSTVPASSEQPAPIRFADAPATSPSHPVAPIAPVDRSPSLPVAGTQPSTERAPAPPRPMAPSIDARLGGLVALVARPVQSADIAPVEPEELIADRFASDLSDAAAALGIQVG